MRGRLCVVRAIPNSLAHPRFGLVVSSAILKKATARNLLKRRLRALVREVSGDAHWDMVVYPNRRASVATFSELKKDVLETINRLTRASSRH